MNKVLLESQEGVRYFIPPMLSEISTLSRVASQPVPNPQTLQRFLSPLYIFWDLDNIYKNMANASYVCYKYITWGRSHSWGRDRDRDIEKIFEYLQNLLLAGLLQKILPYLLVAMCIKQYKISMQQTQTEKFILAGCLHGNTCAKQALRPTVLCSYTSNITTFPEPVPHCCHPYLWI